MQPSTNVLKAQVWSLLTDPKIKVFLWKILCGALPVATSLIKRGMKIDERCQWCGVDGESINHVMFSCSWSRQVWALAGIPSPQMGFHNGSVFSNFHYLLMNRDNKEWPVELRNSFPWILWRIWKNRNLASFEGMAFSPLESAQKAKEDWLEWTEAQIIDEEGEKESIGREHVGVSVVEHCGRRVWKPPPLDWLKCNIGVSWSNSNKIAGGAWVLRDHLGVVLLHSRRAFSFIPNKNEATLKGLLWTIESMRSHGINRVIFGIQDQVLVDAVSKPKAWPSYRYQSSEAIHALVSLKEWKMFLENGGSNRGATLIAQSVTNDLRLQSYVAAGYPSWLTGLFEGERVSSSV